MKRLVGIIDSMTPDERRNPSKMIDQSRRRRIAAGAGVEPHEVNELVKQFDAMAHMMTSLAGKGMRERMKMVRELQSGMMQQPERTGKTESRHRQAADAEGKGQAQERARKGIAPPQTRAETRRWRRLNAGLEQEEGECLCFAIEASDRRSPRGSWWSA